MKKNKKIILIAVAVVIILSAAVLLSIVLIKKQPNTTNEDTSETDIVTTEAEIIPDENDLSVYFGCPVENILSAFPDMVADQNNNKYYYNDEISVNLDLDGNVLSISLDDNGEKNIFGVRCGMTEEQAKEILEKCSRYNEDPTATVTYLCDPDIKVVELWGIFGSADDPEDSFSTEGYISTDGELSSILGGTKEQLLQYYPKALAIKSENGYDYYYAGTTFYFDENGRLYKEVFGKDSRFLIAGIAVGMPYSEVCSTFDFAQAEYRVEGNKIIRDDYYWGTCMIIEFADDQTVDNIVNIRQDYDVSP
ncbi:MAG: hypothetical protein J6Q94_04855 [Clostridia bacterium]|nr:hypothetical protein [Clostridia bacterium]